MKELNEKVIHIDITDLVVPPTIEEEFSMERRVLEFEDCENKEELRKYGIKLLRQNMHQSHFISRCLEQIAALQAKVICLENPVKQPEKNWLQKMFY